MDIITIKVDEKKYAQIKKFYAKNVISRNNGEYIDYIAKVHEVIITAYLSSKPKKTITFNGERAKEESSLWEEEKTPVKISTKAKTVKNNVKEKVSSTKAKLKEKSSNAKATVKARVSSTINHNHWVDLDDQIGSDEVGVGDFLAPMIVVATYIKKKDIPLLNELGVTDSKKLTDDKIREIGETLVKKIEYSKLTLSNEKYNELIAKKENLNSIKAKLHNRALNNLYQKHPETIGVYVDQFVSKNKYYEYLNDPNEKVVKDISFRTKGETLYPSVAAASIIARYAFLLEVDALNKQYDTIIPLGAGKQVNEFSRRFIQEHGIMEFNKIAKRNFANYKDVISMKLI